MEISANEQKLINLLRNLKPFERIEIMADGDGRADSFVVMQTSKRMLLKEKEVFMQVPFRSFSKE